MRTFVDVVFDDWIVGLTPVYSPSYFDTVLPRVSVLGLQAVVDSVGGIAPRITVLFQHSGDARNWLDKGSVPPISSATLDGGITTTLFGADGGSEPALPYVRVLIRLEGTNPRAHVRLWVCGRRSRGNGDVLLSPASVPATGTKDPDDVPREEGTE